MTVLDNLSRAGSIDNLLWLRRIEPKVDFFPVDLRDFDSVETVLKTLRPAAVLHLAAQVAVTKSVEDPRLDFATNATGTFNLLEALRLHSPESRLIYASTNKVYGDLAEMAFQDGHTRVMDPEHNDGISETCQLNFHSPYGCSKGTADQYVLDYSRIYGMRGTSLRQSCIYGPRQFGVEDQGWIAWFMIAGLLGRAITVFGDGKQVRDALHVDDLIDLYAYLVETDDHAGVAFNVGGGFENSLSLLELLARMRNDYGLDPKVSYAPPRQGDQRYFVSDNSLLKSLSWSPKVDLESGLHELHRWLKSHLKEITAVNT